MFKILKANKWIVIPLALGAITILIFKVFLLIAYVPTPSMAPLIDAGTIGICSRTSYLQSVPDTGDVVVFSKDEKLLVKRVIGIPGDTIVLAGETIIRNGEKLSEVYVKSSPSYEEQTFTVPKGKVLLLGDNRTESLDARSWSDPYVSQNAIIGKWISGVQINQNSKGE